MITIITLTVSAQTNFVDPRDGKSYETVVINNKIMFTEPLAYKTADIGVYYKDRYTGLIDNTVVYYNYYEAQNVCPSNWRLTIEKDWMDMSGYYKRSEFNGYSGAAGLSGSKRLYLEFSDQMNGITINEEGIGSGRVWTGLWHLDAQPVGNKLEGYVRFSQGRAIRGGQLPIYFYNGKIENELEFGLNVLCVKDQELTNPQILVPPSRGNMWYMFPHSLNGEKFKDYMTLYPAVQRIRDENMNLVLVRWYVPWTSIPLYYPSITDDILIDSSKKYYISSTKNYNL